MGCHDKIRVSSATSRRKLNHVRKQRRLCTKKRKKRCHSATNTRSNELFVKKMLKLGIEPKTFALLARRSNQLSYSSTERA